MRGGVAPYAAQTNALIDAELAKKGGLRTEIEVGGTVSFWIGNQKFFARLRKSSLCAEA